MTLHALLSSPACAGQPGPFFGPDDETERARGRRERKAKQVCAACPLRAACLEYAIDNRIKSGVWGGMGEDERLNEFRRRRKSGGRNCPAGRAARIAAVKAVGVKTCAQCRLPKSLEAFSRDGQHPWCQDCVGSFGKAAA